MLTLNFIAKTTCSLCRVPINNRRSRQPERQPPFSPSEFDPEDLNFSGEYYPELDMGRTPPRTRIARNMKEKRSRGVEFSDKGSRLGSREGSKSRRRSVAEYSPAKEPLDPQEIEFCK